MTNGRDERVVWFSALGKDDAWRAGSKGANLGELSRLGLPVPPGFVVTADVYRQFLETTQLAEVVDRRLAHLNVDDPERLQSATARIKKLILSAEVAKPVAEAIVEAYRDLDTPFVAVRGSAVARGLPEAAFAGQYASILNVSGERGLLTAVKHCWASLFEPQAVFYRAHQNYGHLSVSASVTVQKMVQATVSGVVFTGEPIFNDPQRVVVEAVWGLGEAVGEGVITPDLYVLDRRSLAVLERRLEPQEWRLERNPHAEDPLHANRRAPIPHEERARPKLNEDELRELVRLALRIEEHFGTAQDIEWAQEKSTFYLLQARPMTALGTRAATAQSSVQEQTGKLLLSGPSGSPGLISGPVRIISHARDIEEVAEGDVLVTDTTDPGFLPGMRRAAAIITDRGGVSSHAAVVSQELGIPSVVGTGTGTQVLRDRQRVTVDGTGGMVLEGIVMPRGRTGETGRRREGEPARRRTQGRGARRTMKKWVYLFPEGSTEMRDLLGGKGAGASEMTRAGLPVPPGFTITTEACNAYNSLGKQFPEGMWDQALEALKNVEEQTGKCLGDKANPLLVSVRSGARVSMPGMMETVLNLGLNDDTLQGLLAKTGDARFAYDAYRRFLQMFGRTVLDIDSQKFEERLEEKKQAAGVETDAELTPEVLQNLVGTFKEIIARETGSPYPTDPYRQLDLAIRAVFNSWDAKRARDYRDFYKISHDLGTAVNVQTMVFGNMGWDSGTGVAFTRNYNTGERVVTGEYLQNAQGEDVVAGIRTPKPIAQLRQDMPSVYEGLVHYARLLEDHYRDMQDLEFTIEHGTLYMLQTRSGKRSATASVKIAVEMVREGLITKEEAVQRVEPEQVELLLHRQIDPNAHVQVIAKGLNASPGAATGKAVFDADRAEAVARQGEKLILVRPETNPDDVHGIIGAQGILTARGGATSHAAVVARGLGKPCVAGCESIQIDVERRHFSVDGVTVNEGDLITINGTTGEVILGDVPLIEPSLSGELQELLTWADETRRLQIWANADYPRDAAKAREYGAEGIGLCRTEHMFFEPERLIVMRQMILAGTDREQYVEALRQLEGFQTSDFTKILEVMDGLPVVIRLLDPPLHEFLPRYDELLEEVIELRHGPSTGSGNVRTELEEKERLLQAVSNLREANPMLGLRGCRLGILYPEMYQMQVRAILNAAIAVQRQGKSAHPEIMIPLIAHINELRVMKEDLVRVADETQAAAGIRVDYKFGTMIEVPRAALTADEIAREAEFFSFGTNDLTQMTFGISRDDAERGFLLRYVEQKILPENPFQVLDRDGVGRLMAWAAEHGRRTRPDLEIGICGEHGGDPASIALCHELGLNYVSCSPFRVPVARLAAAQAALARATIAHTA